MNTLLLAVDDGIANANFNWADVFFLVATILAVIAAVAYASGVRPVGDNTVRVGWHAYAAALLALAVAGIAFALFLL